MMKLPRIIFACGREPTYVRNALLWRSLHGNFDSSLVSDARHGSLTFKLARVSLKLLKALSQPHDLVVIGFYGHPLMLLARRFSTCPIIFDPFVSTFDTLIADRNQIQQGSIFAQFLLQLDRKALQTSNAIITDTDTNANFYAKEFQVARDKFTTLYVSCDERIFFPRSDKNDSNRFTVFTYSSYMPLHGMDVIVEAAKLCQELPICFRLVGNTGPQYQVVYEQAKKHNLNNIEFIADVPLSVLPTEIAKASICLGGPFGTTPKAGRVITGKTFQFIGMAKPTILTTTQANYELFQSLPNEIFCQPGSAPALANAIKTLYENTDLRNSAAIGAHQLFESQLQWSKLEPKFIGLVHSTLSTNK